VAGSFFMELFRSMGSGGMALPSDLEVQTILHTMLLLIPLFFILLIMQALFTMAPYIVTFGRRGAWDSMVISVKIVAKRLLQFILFFIVIGLINIGGAILLLIGLLYTIPLSLCSLYAAYEMIVGTQANDPLLDAGT